MEMRVNGMRAKQNRFDVLILFRDDKKIDSFQKTKKKSIIRHSGLFPLKVGRKKHFNNIFFFAASKIQHLPRVKLSLFSKHPFGGFYR